MQRIMKKPVIRSILVLNRYMSSAIVNSIEKPDHITTPMLRERSSRAFLNRIAAEIANNMPEAFMRQSINPLDLARNKFQMDSLKAESIKYTMPI